MKSAAAAIEAFGAGELAALERGDRVDVLGQPVTHEDVVVRREPRADVVIETEGSMIVALDPTLDEGLVREGIAREVVSTVQKLRKEGGLEITDRIRLVVHSADAVLRGAVESERASIAADVLAVAIEVDAAPGDAVVLQSVQGEHALTIEITRA
jgi:isoleucyl-tRNA synthetase